MYVSHTPDGPDIYIASKLRHGKMLADLLERAHLSSGSSWTEIVGKIADTPENAAVFWRRNMIDVGQCDMVLVYAEPGDKLRGALIEAGAALAIGKPVFVVGDHEDFGTWQYFPNVIRCRDLNHAIWGIKHLAGIPCPNYSDSDQPLVN